jgi:hypothetical protein
LTLHQTTVSLAVSAYQVAWEHLDAGPMPIVLYVPPEGARPDDRARAVDSAWAELRGRELAEGRRLRPWFADALRLLAEATVSVDVRFGIGRDAVRGLAAAREEAAVLATLAPETLRLRLIGHRALAEESVGLLPPHPAGPGSPVSLPVGDVDVAAHGAGSSLYSLADHLVGHGVPQDQARSLVEMTAGTFRRGQFGATMLDSHGRRHRLPRVVAVHDTPAGRYLMEQRSAANGRQWTTVAPADGARLGRAVRDLLTELAECGC